MAKRWHEPMFESLEVERDRAEAKRWKREADEQAKLNMERGMELVRPLLEGFGRGDEPDLAAVFSGAAAIAEKAHVEREIVEAERDAALERLAAARDALVEARPYVFGRTADKDWRGETAKGVLGRVDFALARLSDGEQPE